MILVSRLQGQPFYLNPDLVMTVESTPDTVITLTNNEKFVVLESPEVLQQRFIEFKRAIQHFSKPA
jgi:flagellar protein FlbD